MSRRSPASIYDDEEEREVLLAVDDRKKKDAWRNNIFVPLGTCTGRYEVEGTGGLALSR